MAVELNGADAGTVAAGASSAVTATVEDMVTLIASPASGYAFTGWTLSAGLSCAEDGTSGATCTFAAGSVTASGGASAAFRACTLTGFPISWTGPGAVVVDGAIATAVPYAPGTFVEWAAGPCAGTMALACDVSAATENAVAALRPFTVAGIKALAFGLGYDLNPQPNH